MLRKHGKMDTVAAEFLKVFKVPGKDVYKVKLRWWTIGKIKAPRCLGYIEKIELTGAKIREFKPYHFIPLTEEQKNVELRTSRIFIPEAVADGELGGGPTDTTLPYASDKVTG